MKKQKKKFTETEFYKKLKQVRVNRVVYLSAIVILLALTVVLAITAATNRAKRSGIDDPEQTTAVIPATTKGEEKNEPKQEQPTVAEDKIPEMALPVSGLLTKGHSVDVQVFSQTMKDYRVHLGVDIATAADAPVCAAADGKVAQIWEDPMMGYCMALTHSGDCVTVYKNLAKDMAEGVTVGSEVKQGQLLGYVGESAMAELAEEPHLHMEMTVGGLQVDPLEYFSEAVLSTLTEDDIYEDGK